MTKINVDKFVDTPVIQKLKKKQSVSDDDKVEIQKPEVKSTPTESATRSARGRKRKYNTDEERIQARRAQQKAYRERKKKEFEELKARATRRLPEQTCLRQEEVKEISDE